MAIYVCEAFWKEKKKKREIGLKGEQIIILMREAFYEE